MANKFATQFAHCTTPEELKRRYLKLAKQHHPDCGGTTEDMQALNSAYEEAVKRLSWQSEDASAEYEKTTETPSWMVDILKDIIPIDGIEVEICGSWIWVGGDTYPHRDIFKAAGFRWSGKKKRWYAKPGNDRRRYRGSMDMDRIREVHGSVKISTGSHQVRRAG